MNVLTGVPEARDQKDIVSFLETIDAATGKRSILKEFDGQVIEAPNWLKGRNAILYNSRGCIWEYSLSDGSITKIDSGHCIHCNNDHVLSPDHSRIAVSHQTKEDFQSRIYTLPLTGGVPVLITPIAPSYLHGWSQDGRTLAYCAERNGQYDIYTIPADGGEETQLTNEPGLDDGPEYSPCGRHIWFCSTRSGLMQVWRMNADGGSPVQMTTDDSNNWFPHVSPDGSQIAYISYRKGDVEPQDHPANKNVELRIMSSDGGHFRILAQVFGGQGTLNVNSWSPDGSTLAFVSYRTK